MMPVTVTVSGPSLRSEKGDADATHGEPWPGQAEGRETVGKSIRLISYPLSDLHTPSCGIAVASPPRALVRFPNR